MFLTLKLCVFFKYCIWICWLTIKTTATAGQLESVTNWPTWPTWVGVSDSIASKNSGSRSLIGLWQKAKLNDDDVEVFEIVCRERFMRFRSALARFRIVKIFYIKEIFNIVSRLDITRTFQQNWFISVFVQIINLSLWQHSFCVFCPTTGFIAMAKQILIGLDKAFLSCFGLPLFCPDLTEDWSKL